MGANILSQVFTFYFQSEIGTASRRARLDRGQRSLLAFLNEADAERTARINQTSSLNGHGDQQKQPKKNQVSKRQGTAITLNWVAS